jgi:hypothetical protein
VWRRVKRIAPVVWASPASIVGLVLAVPILLIGASARTRADVLEIALANPTSYRRRIPFDAITFGHVVLGRSIGALDELREHELEHVKQFERWGVLMLVAYPLSSLAQALRGRDPYRSNYFETQARARSDHKRS